MIMTRVETLDNLLCTRSVRNVITILLISYIASIQSHWHLLRSYYAWYADNQKSRKFEGLWKQRLPNANEIAYFGFGSADLKAVT